VSENEMSRSHRASQSSSPRKPEMRDSTPPNTSYEESRSYELVVCIAGYSGKGERKIDNERNEDKMKEHTYCSPGCVCPAQPTKSQTPGNPSTKCFINHSERAEPKINIYVIPKRSAFSARKVGWDRQDRQKLFGTSSSKDGPPN